MKIIAVIPARWQSSRFPGKPLALLADKPIIQHVYENVRNCGIFEKVIIATDSEKIVKAVELFGGRVELTKSDHRTGTDRIAEVCRKYDFDLVINVQGDEPFISSEPLIKLARAFEEPNVQAASLMHVITHNLDDPNQVKVVCNKNSYALYFSRSLLPYNRDKINNVIYYGHVGVYGYRKEALLKFVSLSSGKLENIEKLEQLRLLENDIPIKMICTSYLGFSIDTPEDLLSAQTFLTSNL
jgi:3-deoxy-manno-octulosonate cytidylyltransferase (CMP-KDO synthetase)